MVKYSMELKHLVIQDVPHKTALGGLKGRQLIKENYSMDKIECTTIISQQQKLSDDKSSK